MLRRRIFRSYPTSFLNGGSTVRVYLKVVEAGDREGSHRAENGVECNPVHTPFTAQVLPLLQQTVRVTAMLRRAFLTTVVVLFTGALAPSIPAKAGMDAAGFINNLGSQLQVVTRTTSPE